MLKYIIVSLVLLFSIPAYAQDTVLSNPANEVSFTDYEQKVVIVWHNLTTSRYESENFQIYVHEREEGQFVVSLDRTPNEEKDPRDILLVSEYPEGWVVIDGDEFKLDEHEEAEIVIIKYIGG